MTPLEQNIEKAKLLLGLAHDDLALVPKIMELGHMRVAISRSYYAAFYAASAILVLDGLEFKKHSAIVSTIGKDYIGKDGITKEHHREYIKLFRERAKSDYEVVVEDSPKPDATEFLKYASNWVRLAEDIFNKRLASM